MSQLRKCSKCGESTLVPLTHEMQPFNSSYGYKCENCEHEVDLVPMGSIGSQMGISLVLVVLIAIFVFVYNDYPEWDTYLYLFGAAAIFLSPSLFDLRKHWQNPQVGNGREVEEPELAPSTNINKSQVRYVESKGFWGGLMAPFLLFATVLGVAAIIGFLKDVVF